MIGFSFSHKIGLVGQFSGIEMITLKIYANTSYKSTDTVKSLLAAAATNEFDEILAQNLLSKSCYYSRAATIKGDSTVCTLQFSTNFFAHYLIWVELDTFDHILQDKIF